MADIIVRIPEDQLQHFWNDKGETALTAFWRFPFRPRQAREDEDYIWFVTRAGVVAGAAIYRITDEKIDSPDPSGKWNVEWIGNWMVELDPPEASVQFASRGFRYAKPEEQELLRRRWGAAKEARDE